MYFVIWLVSLVTAIFLFKKVAGTLSLSYPNLISIVFYYSLFLSSFIGALLIVYKIDQFYMINKLVFEENRVIGFSIIAFIMVFMPLSMLIVSLLVGFNAKKEFQAYVKAPVAFFFNGSRSRENEFYVYFFILSMMGLGAVAYTLLKVGDVPLFHLFMGSSDLAALRIEASHQFKGNTLIRNIFGIGLTPILSFAAYIYALKTRQWKWRILFFFLLIGSVLINTYDLAKAPIFFYLLMFLLIRIYIGKTRLRFSKIILLGTSAAVLLIVMYVFVQDVRDIGNYLSYSSGPVGRLILSQISPFFLHLDLFGHFHPFLNGRSLPSSLVNLFGFEQLRSAEIAMQYYFPEKVEEGTAGVLNTLFAAEAYANFGYIGVVFGTIYVGVLIQLIYIIFLRLPKHPFFLSLFIYFTVNIPRVVVGGFMDFLYNPLWISLLILTIGLLLFFRFRVEIEEYIKRARKFYHI